jgi:opacity protein-like surface antigen
MNLNLAKHSTGITMFLIVVCACILFTSFAYAQDMPSFSIGAFGGFASSMTGEAVKDYDDTEWETGTAYGGSVMYRMANGFVFELLVEQFEMKAVENGDDIGTLKATPILLMIGYQSMPINQSGLAFHATIGGGFASSKLEKGDDIKDLESSSGVSIDISNDNAFMFEMGAGVDYFLTRNIALTLDGRFVAGNIDSEWDFSNGNSEDYTLYASNFQGLVGVRLWF